jgi:hypothetical protein
MGKIDFSAFLTGFGIGCGFLLGKDEWIGFKGATVVLLLMLSSCVTYNKWRDEGIKHGWYDTTKKDSTSFELKADSTQNKNFASNASDSVSKVLNTEARKEAGLEVTVEEENKIEKIIEEKAIKPAIKNTFKDTTFKTKEGVEVEITPTEKGLKEKITYPKNSIQPCDGHHMKFYAIIGALSVVLGFVCYLLFLSIKDERNSNK